MKSKGLSELLLIYLSFICYILSVTSRSRNT